MDYESHLKKTQADWESRWENVQELITFASEVNTDNLAVDEEELEERCVLLKITIRRSHEHQSNTSPIVSASIDAVI